MKKVIFIELTVFERIIPLVSGYLQAYACEDEDIKSYWSFEKYSVTLKTSMKKIINDLLRREADLYAFSCYCWNMGIVRAMIPALLQNNPKAYIIMGGPQVEHYGETYLDPRNERFVLCNGEGEKTFRNFLKQIIIDSQDFSSVRGLSYYRDHQLFVNEDEERIRNLDEIPSPFLNGLIETGTYTTAIIETNRGCPYQCKFCYWGSSARVCKFGDERIKAELTWLAKNNFFYIWLIDGNWGLFERDEDFTRYIAENKIKYKMPVSVYFHGAKKNPERLIRITQTLDQADLATPLSISFQSLNPDVLRTLGRTNMDMKTFEKVQRELNDKKLSSHLELMWPLPGESLSSFQDGINRLCALKAESFLIYPLLLLNNIVISREREKYGLVAVKSPDHGNVSELEIVIQTETVSKKEYKEGIRFSFAVLILYSIRCLSSLGHYLNSKGQMSYAQLFAAFVDYCNAHKEYPLVELYERMISELRHYDFHSVGEIIHFVLHGQRENFETFLIDFVKSQKWWADEGARAFFEIDLVNRPFVYINTPIRKKNYPFEVLKVLKLTDTGYVVEIPRKYAQHLPDIVQIKGDIEDGNYTYDIKCRFNQFSFVQSNTPEQNAFYCQERLHAIRSILSVWMPVNKADYVQPELLEANMGLLEEDEGDFGF